MVLKQNQQLLSENEKMARYMHQLKSEYEILKNKCDTYSAQKLAMTEDYETERKRSLRDMEMLDNKILEYRTANETLKRDIEMLDSKLVEQKSLYESEINDIKRQFTQELQNYKQQYTASVETSERENRKLKS